MTEKMFFMIRTVSKRPKRGALFPRRGKKEVVIVQG
jgi:hypothetical protein